MVTKTNVTLAIDAIFGFLIFVVGKGIGTEWMEVVKPLFLVFQPVVLGLVLHWLKAYIVDGIQVELAAQFIRLKADLLRNSQKSTGTGSAYPTKKE